MEAFDFKEVQRFRIRWAWMAIIAMNLLFIYANVQQVIIGKPFGSKPAPDYVLIIIELFFLLFCFFLFSIKLKTRITGTGIYYRFYPFQIKETEIEWHALRDAYMRKYNSFYEYGGWGIRSSGTKTGNAINTSASSNTGLQLEFKNGKLLLIGTRRPDEIKLIIDTILSSGKINRGV